MKAELSSKPRSTLFRPELTQLSELTRGRRIMRWLTRRLARLLVRMWTYTEVTGLDNLPARGPALIVANHLGDADLIVGLAISPVSVEPISKAELHDYPLLGSFMDTYGVIWVHRGLPDRKALRAALQGLQEGRMIAIAPEARESLTGALEEGTGGAAYLALKADAPIVPVTFTGTENRRIYGNMKHFRRTKVTLTLGRPFRLEKEPDWRESVTRGTQRIMQALASQLPPEYHGVYSLEAKDFR